ncbi:MAG TPA: hydroxymethylbilane synthase [Thermoleophilaceae bacterium]|nr:hydroxymethylbilane synthase [Thermoleophilaceae bacterium]
MPNPSRHPLRLGTRGSALAIAQAGRVSELLARLGEDVELVTITTSGDERPAGPPAQILGDKSRFVKEIEEALLAGEVDLGVHSAKDVPSELPDGLAIVGVPARADPRDALCVAEGGRETLDGLPAGASVGTASLRRRAQLLARRPDLDVRALRGNVDTRLRRLAEGELTAIVLAAAGLTRLGREEGRPIAESVMTPAPGQGCLALEAREGDVRARELAARLTHRDSLAALTAERALVGGIGASCHTPVGAHARLEDGTMHLDAFAGLPDGSAWIRDSMDGPAADPGGLGAAVARRLLAAGAAELLEGAERWPEG